MDCPTHGCAKARTKAGKLFCGRCDAERAKRWRVANKQRDAANKRAYFLANRERCRKYSREYAERARRAKGVPLAKRSSPEDRSRKLREKNWRRFGIVMTLQQFDRLVDEQCGVCRICQQAPVETLHVDHCHKTGRVRGLLCGECNRGLGNFRDSVRLLQAAVEYLTESFPSSRG